MQLIKEAFSYYMICMNYMSMCFNATYFGSLFMDEFS